MTTFTTRETIRDRLKALYDATNDFEAVYSGIPKWSDMAGQSPVLTVISDGTQTTFQGLNKNPREHFFVLTTWVLYSIESDSWTYAQAEDLLDTLEASVLQVIRDNAAGSTVGDLIEPTAGASQIDRIVIEQNYRYITESRRIRVYLATGVV